jgi:hypothetical protein
VAAELAVDLSGARECNPASDDCGLNAALVRVAGPRAYLVLQRYLGAFSGRTPARVVSFDVSRPDAPRELAQWGTTSSPVSIALGDDHVLAASRPLWWYAGIAPCQLVDGGLDALDRDLLHQGRLAAPTGGNAVQIYGGRAWVADPVRRLASYEVRPPDPARPVPGGGIGYGSPYGSAEARDLVVDGAHGVRFVVGGQTAGFQAGAERSSAPSAPLNGCSPPPGDHWFRRIASDGTHDVLLDLAAGLQVFEPGESRALGRLGDVRASDVAARDAQAYLAGDEGLTVVVVGDPAAPVVAGSLTLAGFGEAVAAPAGSGLVALAGPNGLALVDATRPDAPRRIGTVEVAGGARDVAVDGHTAYVVVGDGLIALDLANAAKPVKAGLADGLRGTRAVAAAEGLVAVLAADGLHVFAGLPDDGSPPRLPGQGGADGRMAFLPALRRGE